ncbi:MAG: ribosome maturation factor RimM [Pseudomonadota bacterium]
MSGDRLICLGQIGAAHGVKGHVRVKPFTETPEGLADYGPLRDENGEAAFKVSTLRVIKGGMLVVKFKGVNDRDAAEGLNGTKLFVERARLPGIDDEDDYYVEDLLGLEAIDLSGIPLGTVQAVHDFGAGDILDIKPEFGPSILVPFTKKAVPTVNFEDHRLEVDRIEAGLVEETGDQDSGPPGSGKDI